MNKIVRTSLFVLTLFAISCDALLDIEADGTITGDVFSNPERIEEALLGAYYSFGGISDGADGGELFGGDFMLIPTLLAHSNDLEIAWDDVNGPAYSDFIDKEIVVTNLRVAANWRRAYEAINLINTVIENIDVAPAGDQNRIHGEALAMRGILYFEMVRLWAPQYSESNTSTPAIPIRTTPVFDIEEVETPTLSTIGQVYNQAENDLMQASTLLQPFGGNGTRLSYYACQAYLARISLQKSDFENALLYANEVIESGRYRLAATPIEGFNRSSNSPEDIFAIQQTLANTAGDVNTGTGVVNYFSSLPSNGLGVARILRNSLNTELTVNSPLYEATDLRYTVDTEVASNATSASISTMFYRNLRNQDPDILSSSKYLRGDQVIPVIRLAEMHLIRAEALFEADPFVINSQALDDLNEIRSRAGLPTVAASFFESPFAFYEAIILERNRELLYEGQLLWDMKRLDRQIGSAFEPINANSTRTELPIPQNETDTGTNPG
ncbi:MAG: RagB/SusD family nutrient uptake outer membrane protein [Bacteroidota bacterium]